MVFPDATSFKMIALEGQEVMALIKIQEDVDHTS